MKYILFTLFFISINLLAKSQVDTIFSFVESQEWKKTPYSEKIKKLEKTIKLFTPTKAKQMLLLATQLYQLSVQNKDSITEVNSLKYIGNCHFYQNKKLMAILQYTKSRKRANEIGYIKGEAAAFHNIALLYFHSDKNEKALLNYQKALHLDSLSGDKHGLAESLTGIGAIYEKQKQYKLANKYLKKSYNIAIILSDNSLISKSLHNLGEVSKAQGDFKMALTYYQKSAKLMSTSSISIQQIQNNYSIGELYERTARFEEALLIYKSVINDSEKIAYIKGEAMALNSIGNILKNQKQYDKALIKYFNSLQIMQQIGDNTGIAIALDNIGNSYEQKKEFENALNYYNSALALKQQINDFNAMAISKTNIGMLRFKMNNTEESINCLLDAYDMYQLSENELELANISKNLGIIHAQNKNYAKAELYLSECVEIAKRRELLQLQKNSYELLSNLSAQQGNYKKAFEFKQLSTILKDSIFSIETQKQLDDIEIKYETDKKEHENKLLKKDNELKNEVIFRQKWGSIGVSVILLFMVFVAVVLFRSRKRQRIDNVRLRKQRNLIQKQAEELQKLSKFKEEMTGMIVHDLKNPLNSIVGLSKNRKVKQSGFQMLTMVTNILDIYKYENTKIKLNKITVSLSDVLESALLQINLLTEEKNIQLINKIQTHFVNIDKEIVERIFVNILTNAIKYTPNNGTITLETNLQGFRLPTAQKVEDAEKFDNLNLGGFITIKITDTGIGIPQNKLKSIFDKFEQFAAQKSGKIRSTGIGLTFCKLFTEAHGGKIWVESKLKKGTSFCFSLPLAKQKNENIENAEIENPKNKKIFSLTEENKERLKPILEKLKNYEVYEISSIETIIIQIENNNENIIEWKKRINESLYAMNNEKYDKLLTFC